MILKQNNHCFKLKNKLHKTDETEITINKFEKYKYAKSHSVEYVSEHRNYPQTT